MKNTGVILMLVYLSGIFILAKTKKSEKLVSEQKTEAFHASSPIVLELFTSEGCSSCPPADKLLQELAANDSNLIPLSFHVDYWNRLGWTDPFSSNAYSKRQEEYGHHFKLDGIYTPQLIVNGQSEMVGSSKASIEKAIRNASGTTNTISVKDLKSGDGKIKFAVSLNGNTKDLDLHAALVQRKATVKISAGENDGTTLSHINIVRDFITQKSTGSNEFILSTPKDYKPADYRLIIYLQHENDFKIAGASVYNF